MTDPTTALRDLDLIATLITRALDMLDTDVSPRATECAIQAAAALHAIASVERDLRTDQATRAVATAPAPSRALEPGALLAAAERELTGLPPHLRNQIAVCAAAAHLRRARRALVTP